MGAAARKEVAKELHALTADERSAALLADAPELLALIEDLQASLHEVRHRVGPLLQEVRSGRLATAEGLSYLEAKHLLMLHYCCHIVFYLMLKAEGRPVRDHPVIMRLVEIRSYLEKIRPIDKQLAYQVDKLLRAASLAATAELQQGGGSAAAGEQEEDEADVMRYGPRPDTLVPKDKGSGLYRPPRLNPVSMEGEMGGGRQSREDQRRMAEAKRRAARSDAVAELAAEVAGAPEELRTALPGFDSMAAIKTRQKLEARQQEEEDIMTRVPLSRDQVKALKAQRRTGMTASSLVGDFADEVADLVAATSAADAGAGATRGNTLADVFARQKVSQRFGAEPARQVTLGGDEDLPRRANLSERRAKFDAVAARKAAMPPQQDDDDNGFEDYDVVPGGRGSSKRGTREQGEEDDFYQAAKEAAASRKKARAEAHRAPQLPPPLPDPSAGARARGITKAIEKNRGLTPHRRKDLKNPRKKHRIMFAKALVRRSGAVQDGSKTRDAGAAAYAGEATGIKSKVAKSRRL
ncbi:Sas10 domain-containing protein [Haematococcus lacustris]|uniref:Sas10 domain-containing protein n=1 Tax=Haematococcus lacustris TaxID=44745 RepID=A0A699Z626_HAELA|nr:Sas10 domain-containing protein [Haematococcus lacustris]